MDPNTSTAADEARRHRMVISQLLDRNIHDEHVLAAMARVPRHVFVPASFREQAYDDNPLPIGSGQTISQPYIVALMLEQLALAPHHTVLEIGTGSGYQTALLAELAGHVYSMERHPSLAAVAESTIRSLGYANVTVRVGDGSLGWPERAPFDAIIVSAATPQFPQTLFDQLRENGRLVVPIGPPDAQVLQVAWRQQGRPVTTSQGGCRFVPLIGEQGYRE